MVWITDQEKKLLEKLRSDNERMLMFGNSAVMQEYKNEALTLLNLAMSQGEIKPHRYQQLLRLIDSNQLDNIKLAVNIIKAKVNE